MGVHTSSEDALSDGHRATLLTRADPVALAAAHKSEYLAAICRLLTAWIPTSEFLSLTAIQRLGGHHEDTHVRGVEKMGFEVGVQ
jgi:hypothetical protein